MLLQLLKVIIAMNEAIITNIAIEELFLSSSNGNDKIVLNSNNLINEATISISITANTQSECVLCS